MDGGRGVRILGIDPGTVTAGFACLEVLERPAPTHRAGSLPPLALIAANVLRASPGAVSLRVIEAGVLRLGGRNAPIEDRLFALGRDIGSLLERLFADEVALEEAFCGKSVRAALRIGEARGVVLSAARARGARVHQFPPARIKRAVAGHGGAGKEAVARMVSRQLALADIPRPADVTDALAVAFCRAAERGDFRSAACNRHARDL